MCLYFKSAGNHSQKPRSGVGCYSEVYWPQSYCGKRSHRHLWGSSRLAWKGQKMSPLGCEVKGMKSPIFQFGPKQNAASIHFIRVFTKSSSLNERTILSTKSSPQDIASYPGFNIHKKVWRTAVILGTHWIIRIPTRWWWTWVGDWTPGKKPPCCCDMLNGHRRHWRTIHRNKYS